MFTFPEYVFSVSFMRLKYEYSKHIKINTSAMISKHTHMDCSFISQMPQNGMNAKYCMLLLFVVCLLPQTRFTLLITSYKYKYMN